jgi:hypothetical protein
MKINIASPRFLKTFPGTILTSRFWRDLQGLFLSGLQKSKKKTTLEVENSDHIGV